MEPIFVCVYIFDYCIEDFLLKGIFTKEEDARELETKLKEAAAKSVYVVRQNLENLKEHILGARLGELKDVLLRLEEKLEAKG